MDKVRLIQGDVLDVLRDLESHSLQGLFCDPPYGTGSGPAWDEAVPPPEVWQQAARVLMPGAWVLAFGGRRTHHRLMLSMEQGGLELRDTLSWFYATGSVSTRTCLRPAWEPIVLARTPGAARELNIEGCRFQGTVRKSDRRFSARGTKMSWGGHGRARTGPRHHPKGKWPQNVLMQHEPECEPAACTPGCPVRMLDDATDEASRFFYCPKPKGEEVEGNGHPTRKPVRLCTYLARLILPSEGGRLLVPYCGSGSEMIGALQAGWPNVVGVEREEEWLQVAKRRVSRLVLAEHSDARTGDALTIAASLIGELPPQ